MVIDIEDFYFVYDYDPVNKKYSKLCRRANHIFQRYDKSQDTWIDDIDLSRIYMGEDVYYDEISEDDAMKLISHGVRYD